MNDTPIYDSNVNKPAESESKVPNAKVVSATVGAGVGSALATIIVWVVNVSTGVDVPEAVELASGVVLTAGLAFVGGYWKRD